MVFAGISLGILGYYEFYKMTEKNESKNLKPLLYQVGGYSMMIGGVVVNRIYKKHITKNKGEK